MTKRHMAARYYGDAVPFDMFDERDTDNGTGGWFQRESLCRQGMDLRDITFRVEEVSCGTCLRLAPVFERRWANMAWPNGVPSFIRRNGQTATSPVGIADSPAAVRCAICGMDDPYATGQCEAPCDGAYCSGCFLGGPHSCDN